MKFNTIFHLNVKCFTNREKMRNGREKNQQRSRYQKKKGIKHASFDNDFCYFKVFKKYFTYF